MAIRTPVLRRVILFVNELRSALMNQGAVDYRAMLEHAVELLELRGCSVR